MTVSGSNTTLSTSAAAIFTATVSGEVAIVNNDATINIFLGGSNVTSAGANGMKLAPGQMVRIGVRANSVIYAVAASGTPVVSALFSGG